MFEAEAFSDFITYYSEIEHNVYIIPLFYNKIMFI